MRADKISKQALNSNARLSYIDVFVPSVITFAKNCDHRFVHFSKFKHTDLSLQLSNVDGGVIRNFPIMIRGDGTPWDLGNLYLMGKFLEMAKLAPPVIATLKSNAKHLVMYLRWIEHLRAEGIDIHELHFPREEEQRVTWAYYRYLKRLLRQKNEQPISLSVARARMQSVVGFYRGLIGWDLIKESAIENVPYKSTAIGIPIVSSVGVQIIKTVQTTNFKIPKPQRERLGVIADGGLLRPLTEDEQSLILEQLRVCGNRAFQLMCLLALYTGARIQTVCTLKIKDVYALLNKPPKNGEVLLLIGEGTGVDTKNQKRYRLHIPIALVRKLRDYIESKECHDRRAISFYGESRENYVFLTSNGSPYYTSTSETFDRQKGPFSKRISAKERVSFPIHQGNAVRNYLSRLIRDIRLKHPDFNSFQFHDFRATYGMNFVRDSEASGAKDVRDELKARMGHSSFNTTQSYLNYDVNSELIRAATVFHHNRINGIIEHFAL
ncbi:tyrosine-type recombinase/integrase [Cellvibrio sp. QJXJ]|uniref:tyrosine-type recombinase/integrase n=1 Tax=Cellvibrio sp. QJXJ TaxID=2964606 RepID=UPI0021C2B88C|nr:site-specific integrase [Cellvibrio sp. QJXJ]UUA72098.1 site-specific integrase [Cellvibrio sp. QJXJ]